jgi:hypothetical protein
VSRSRLELLQWVGLLAAPLAWTVQLVVGFGVTQAACGPAGREWGVSTRPWEIALAIACGAVALAGQACALRLFRTLAGVEYDDAGPAGRLRFFSVAALFGNTLFVVAIALTAAGALAHVTCRQA